MDMHENLDILYIDNKIRDNFEEEFSTIDIHKEKLLELKNSLEDNKLKGRIKKKIIKSCEELKDYIKELENQTRYNFYVLKTIQLIDEYKKILNKPMKISFLGKPSKNNKIKIKIIKDYIEIARNYIDINLQENKLNNKKNDTKINITCDNCSNKKNFEIINNDIYICTVCYAQQTIKKYNSSYDDINRINISSKYMYDRKIHFRDCIKQYQGKQNSTIPEQIYNKLEEQFKLHHLLVKGKNLDKKTRFKNITKNHIMIFLKELQYSNHYENVNLIHYNLTGIKPDDISHLEDHLLDDFDILAALYDKEFKHINRKNFINTQYVLYQLLRRHKHKCKKEEFIILKTIDRKFFHDEICKILFEKLNWNHTPFY